MSSLFKLLGHPNQLVRTATIQVLETLASHGERRLGTIAT